MKNLERAVRLFRALAETEHDVQVTSATLWSWPEVESVLEINPDAKRLLAEMRNIPAGVRARTMRYCGEFEPLSPSGDLFVFQNNESVKTFIKVMEAQGAVVEHLADFIVSAHGETPDYVAEVANQYGGVPWDGPALADAFEFVDTDLPYAMMSDAVEPEHMEEALVVAMWKDRNTALSEAFITSKAPSVAERFRGRLSKWAIPRPVFGVDARVFEALRSSGALPARVCAMVEVAPATVSAPGTALNQGDDRGGVAMEQPAGDSGTPAQSAQSAQKEPPKPTEHVPTQEEGGADVMGQIKLPDGTVVPPDIMRQAISKVLKNIATQIEQGTTGGQPEPKPAQDAGKPQGGDGAEDQGDAPDQEAPEQQPAPAAPPQKPAAPAAAAPAQESYRRGIREDLNRALGLILSPRTRDVIAGIGMVRETGFSGQPQQVVERVLDELDTLQASPNVRVRRAAREALDADLYRTESAMIAMLPDGLAYGNGLEVAPGTPVVVVEDRGTALVVRLQTGETVLAPTSAVSLTEASVDELWRSKNSRARVAATTQQAHTGKTRRDQRSREIRASHRATARKGEWGKTTGWQKKQKKAGTSLIGRVMKRLGASVEGGESNLEEDRKSVGAAILGRPYTLNVATVSPGAALSFAKDAFEGAGLSLYDEIPDFDRNFLLLKRKMRHALDIPRIQMPVIEPADIDQFEKDLKAGRVDIFKPYAAGALGGGQFPWYPELHGGSSGKEWLTLGVKDGDKADDIVVPAPGMIPVKNLMPLQGEIWFDKLIGSLLKFGIPKAGGFLLTDATIIVSQEGYILDGHHRFGQAMLTDPDLKISAVKIPMDIHMLLKVGRSYGSAIGNKPKGANESGSHLRAPFIKGTGALYTRPNPFETTRAKTIHEDKYVQTGKGNVLDVMRRYGVAESINEQLDVGQEDETTQTAKGFAKTAAKLKTCRQHTFDLVTADLVQLESLAKAVDAKRTSKLLAQTRDKATEFLDMLKETADLLDKANEAFKGESGGKGGDTVDQPEAPAAVAAAPAAVVAPAAPGVPAPAAPVVGEAVRRLIKTDIPRRIQDGGVYSDIAEAISFVVGDLGLTAAQVSEVYDRFNRVALSHDAGPADYQVEFSPTDHRLLESVKHHGRLLPGLVARAVGRRQTFATRDELSEAVSTLREHGKVEHAMLADDLAAIVDGAC